MAIPTVYRSTDPGAPVISSATAGSGLAAIRACLVTGYGSQAPAGWIEEFSGVNKAVFRSVVVLGGPGCYVRIDDTSSSSSNPPLSVITYSSMSDVDTGLDPTHEVFGSRSINGGGAVDWFLIATSAAFYFSAVGSGAAVSRCFCGAGNLVGAVHGDVYSYFALGRGVSSAVSGNMTVLYGPCWSASSSNTGLSLGRDDTGLYSPQGCDLIKPISGNANDMVGGARYPDLPARNSAAAAGIHAYVTHGISGSAVIRGRLPGIILPLFNTTGVSVGAVTPSVPITAGSETVLVKNTASNGAVGGFLIETKLDWG